MKIVTASKVIRFLRFYCVSTTSCLRDKFSNQWKETKMCLNISGFSEEICLKLFSFCFALHFASQFRAPWQAMGQWLPKLLFNNGQDLSLWLFQFYKLLSSARGLLIRILIQKMLLWMKTIQVTHWSRNKIEVHSQQIKLWQTHQLICRLEESKLIN